ncbi:hypothetical protein [Saccharopolyspora sp. NPDC002376]
MLDNWRVLGLLPVEWSAGYAPDNGEVLVTGGFPEEPEVVLSVHACRSCGKNYRAALACVIARFFAATTGGEFVQFTTDLLRELERFPVSAVWGRRGGFPQCWRTESVAGSRCVRVLAGAADGPRGLVVVESAKHGQASYVDDLALLLAEVLMLIANEAFVV